jgi:hypothetical protein
MKKARRPREKHLRLLEKARFDEEERRFSLETTL